MTPEPQGQPPQKSNSTLFIVLVVIAVVACCPVAGIVAAIAIPNFIKFQTRSRQAECKVYLKGLYTAERSFFAQNGRYIDDLNALGFTVENTRYAYVVGRTIVKPTMPRVPKEGLLEQVPGTIREPLGVQKDEFTLACVGSIDNDPAVDVWTISSKDRVIQGETVPAGVPHNDLSDVTD